MMLIAHCKKATLLTQKTVPRNVLPMEWDELVTPLVHASN